MSKMQIIKKIECVARPEINKHFAPDSCIPSTRIIINVLREFGIRAEPLSVKVEVLNRAYYETIETMPPGITREEGGKRLLSAGAAAIGIGFGTHLPNKWTGHLVAFVPELNLLIDASIDQAARPEKKILLPPVLVADLSNAEFTIEDFLVNKNNAASLSLKLKKQGCAVRYTATPYNTGYLASNAWTSSKITKNAVKGIIKKIR